MTSTIPGECPACGRPAIRRTSDAEVSCQTRYVAMFECGNKATETVYPPGYANVNIGPVFDQACSLAYDIACAAPKPAVSR